MTSAEIVQAKKDAARRLMEKDFERLAVKYGQAVNAVAVELPEEIADLQQMWRLAGLGEPPPFKPAFQMVLAG